MERLFVITLKIANYLSIFSIVNRDFFQAIVFHERSTYFREVLREI